MALIWTRPKALQPYIQLAPGEEGYISPAALIYLVDHSTFTRPMQTSQAPVSDHVERGRLTSLASRTVAVTFSTAFTSQPIGKEPDVYRIEAMGGGYRRQEVLWAFQTAAMPTTTGFTIIIDGDESLTGIIIEYEYKQI